MAPNQMPVRDQERLKTVRARPFAFVVAAAANSRGRSGFGWFVLAIVISPLLAGFALVLWFIIRLYRAGLAHAERWQQGLSARVRLAALVGCTGILIHSFFDFNLQIPANAALFYVLTAVAAGAPYQPAPQRFAANRPPVYDAE